MTSVFIHFGSPSSANFTMEQELYHTLQSTLSPDAATRSAAEQNLDRLLGSPGERLAQATSLPEC
jgi:hypothetical protein